MLKYVGFVSVCLASLQAGLVQQCSMHQFRKGPLAGIIKPHENEMVLKASKPPLPPTAPWPTSATAAAGCSIRLAFRSDLDFVVCHDL